ncbi:MAG: hypothetical protein OHK0029_43270 [Armatimonadaceae bacterium]
MNQQDEAGNGTEVVVAYVAPNEWLAEMVRANLESEGIPARIGERVTDAYAPVLQVSEGYWGEVVVPAEFAERAQEVIAALEAGAGAFSDEELAAAAEEAGNAEAL